MPTIAEYQDIAHHYRVQSKHKSGVVLIWRGQVYGWKNRLRNPEHERPGAIAVDVTGRVYHAIGGNAQDGAKSWALIIEDKLEN